MVTGGPKGRTVGGILCCFDDSSCVENGNFMKINETGIASTEGCLIVALQRRSPPPTHSISVPPSSPLPPQCPK